MLTTDSIERFLQLPSQLDVRGQELMRTSVVSRAPSRSVVIAPVVGGARGDGAMDAREKGKEKIVEREKRRRRYFSIKVPLAFLKKGLVVVGENLALTPTSPPPPPLLPWRVDSYSSLKFPLRPLWGF